MGRYRYDSETYAYTINGKPHTIEIHPDDLYEGEGPFEWGWSGKMYTWDSGLWLDFIEYKDIEDIVNQYGSTPDMDHSYTALAFTYCQCGSTSNPILMAEVDSADREEWLDFGNQYSGVLVVETNCQERGNTAAEHLENIISTYNLILEGNVYGYFISELNDQFADDFTGSYEDFENDTIWNEVDDCCGFISEADGVELAEEILANSYTCQFDRGSVRRVL